MLTVDACLPKSLLGAFLLLTSSCLPLLLELNGIEVVQGVKPQRFSPEPHRFQAHSSSATSFSTKIPLPPSPQPQEETSQALILWAVANCSCPHIGFLLAHHPHDQTCYSQESLGRLDTRCSATFFTKPLLAPASLLSHLLPFLACPSLTQPYLLLRQSPHCSWGPQRS